jgi:hypothetical protein
LASARTDTFTEQLFAGAAGDEQDQKRDGGAHA